MGIPRCSKKLLEGNEVDHPSYEDPRDMPVDDEDMPPPQGTRPEPDLDDDPPSQPPGGSAQVPVPGGEHDDSEPDAPLDPDDNGGGQPPGGGPQGPEPYVHGAACSLGSRCTGE